jgi:hypothetical protein
MGLAQQRAVMNLSLKNVEIRGENDFAQVVPLPKSSIELGIVSKE